jgi:hypothetical protein
MTDIIQMLLVAVLIGAALHDGRFGLGLMGYALFIVGFLRVWGTWKGQQ